MLPNRNIFSHRPVPTAWNITQDPIKQECTPFLFLPRCLRGQIWVRFKAVWQTDDGKDGCIGVCDNECWAGKTGGLVDEEVCSLVITVVRYEEAGRNAS